MKSKIGILLVVVFTLLISGLGLPTAFAYTQTSIGDDLFSTGTYPISTSRYITQTSPVQQRIFKHSSGKVIVLTDSVLSDEHLFVNVFSLMGVQLAHVDLYSVYSYSLTGGSSIAEIDSTYILIAIGVGSAAGGKVYTVKFNIITSTFTSKSITFTDTGTSGIGRIGTPILYNGDFYIFAYDEGYGGGTGYGIAKYNIAGDTLTKVGETALEHLVWLAPPYGYLDDTTGKIYYMYTDPDTQTFSIKVFDCGASTWADLATAPFTGGFPGSNAFRYGYGNFITMYGGGILQSGTYYYLYYAWSYSDRTGANYPAGSGVRFASTYFWYMKFNNSISSGTMLLQNWITDYNLDSSNSIFTGCGLSWGYLSHVSGTDTFDIYTYYQDIHTVSYISKVIYYITDITSDPASFTSETIHQGFDNIDWKYIDYDAQMFNDVQHGISYHLISGVESYLSVGGPVLGKIYTFSDSYAPADSPLLTNKNYVVTYNVYVNGVADDYNETAKIFVDGVERITKSIPSSGSSIGKVVFNMLIGTAGTHSTMIKIYNNLGNYEAISDETSYTFIASAPPVGGVPEAPTLIGFYSDIFMLWLPIGIIVFLPLVGCTMLGARYAGGAGAIVGMVFGGATGMIGGTVTGIIPTYALYLLVLLIAVAIVMLFVRGSGGGGEAP